MRLWEGVLVAAEVLIREGETQREFERRGLAVEMK